MICQEFIPQPQLQPFVQSYQLRHFIFSGGSSIPFKPYAPRPEQTLAFFPRGSESEENLTTNTMILRPRSVIIGQYSQRTNRHLIGSEFCVLLVNLKPGVLYRLIGVPFTELTNTFIDAEDILPKEIRQRMGISPELFTRIARMTKAFSMKYNHPGLDWFSIALYCKYMITSI